MGMMELDQPRPGSLHAFEAAAKLHDAGEFAQAEALLRDAIARDPNNVNLRNARGVMFAGMERHLDALWCYRDALACDPNAVGVWTNLGNALTQLNYLKSAIACHQRAIELSDDGDALLYHNLGTSLAEAGQHGEAVLAFSNALRLRSDYHRARWDRGLSYLYLGNYGQGWADYEVRKITGQLPIRELPGVAWTGQPYAGQRLLVATEQGFGDMLWVARYFARVKALGGELIIECRSELLPLIESMGVADQLIPSGAPLPVADFHCYICSLPGIFTPNVVSIPAASYILPPKDRLAKFSALIPKSERRLKVASYGPVVSRSERIIGARSGCSASFRLARFPASSCTVCKWVSRPLS